MGDIVIMGPPGSGKGTQAKLVADQPGWIWLSTGEIFRHHARVGSELGALARSFLDRGEYVPDDVTVRMVRERMREIPKTTRVMFDGFPRTVAQAEALDVLLAEIGRGVGGVPLLDVPRDELTKRLTERGKKEHRSDDTPDVIATRYDVYLKQTAPVIQHYERQKLLRRVDGRGTPDEVGARMKKALEGMA